MVVLAVVFYLLLLVGSGALVLVGVDTLLDGFERYREYTVITDWPVASMDAVALGRTAVVGTARSDGRTLTVPFGEQPESLVYHVTVEDTNKVELPHVDERVAEPFVLEGETGEVRVDATDLRLDLSADREWETEVESHEEIPADLENFAAKHAMPDQGLERDRRFAYSYVAPGDRLFVYGRAVPDDERDAVDGKGALVTAHDREGGFLSNKDRQTLLAERRGALLRHFGYGVTEAVVGLAVFLWLSGIAQLLLGA